MEWAIAGTFGVMALACPLIMVGMMVFGWLFMRRRSGSHSGHGMMMCHGESGGGNHEEHHETTKPLVEELRAQREQLDHLIARAEEKAAE